MARSMAILRLWLAALARSRVCGEGGEAERVERRERRTGRVVDVIVGCVEREERRWRVDDVIVGPGAERREKAPSHTSTVHVHTTYIRYAQHKLCANQ